MSHREINIPFGGFYESMWSSLVDDECERTAEYDANERQREDAIPKELQLDESVYQEAMFAACDYSAGYALVAADYVDAFNTWLTERLDTDLGLKLCHIASPREYNFETNRLFSHITDAGAQTLFDYSKNLDGHATLKALIAERFTSRSGFISSYDNDLENWLEKPLSEWDHNELGTLLLVPVREFEGPKRDETLSWHLYEILADDSYRYADAAVDWPKYQAIIDDAREALRLELLEADPDYVMPTPRCDQTLELPFA